MLHLAGGISLSGSHVEGAAQGHLRAWVVMMVMMVVVGGGCEDGWMDDCARTGGR